MCSTCDGDIVHGSYKLYYSLSPLTMARVDSPTAAINEIEAYLRGAEKYIDLVNDIKGSLRLAEGRRMLKRVAEMQKKAAAARAAWLQLTRQTKLVLSQNLKKVRTSKKLLKIYHGKTAPSKVAAFKEKRK